MIMPLEVPPTAAGELVGLGDPEEVRKIPDGLTMVWMNVWVVVGVEVRGVIGVVVGVERTGWELDVVEIVVDVNEGDKEEEGVNEGEDAEETIVED
jgi:hypothetical protein